MGVTMERQVRLLIPLFLAFQLLIAGTLPKYEFRAAWIATVSRIDFPKHPTSVAVQKSEIVYMLDALQAANFNAVVFQIRPACDAFYNSNYEPWSHYLTGVSGQAPDPYYDPLEYFIEEAHKRNIELHAWFNPYRVIADADPAILHSSHVYHQHPEWVLTISSSRSAGTPADPGGMYSNTILLGSESNTRDTRSTAYILDPGKAAVRNYVLNVYMDVVKNYAVDGIHMDDYFYPYEGITSEDATTFATESRGFTDIDDWRRDNINLFVASVYDSIQNVKPWVKFGVSPFGIWKSGYPEGIWGTSSYSAIYCDPIAWLNAGTVDYITPQLYWPFEGGQDYGKLMPWWADSISTHNRHLYVGHAPYRIVDYHNWAADELPNQIRLNRTTPGCQGSVFFRIRLGVLDNPKGFLDSLKTDLYLYPALTPAMPWKGAVSPPAPCNVYVDFDGAESVLNWESGPGNSDDELVSRYVIYHSESSPVDIDDPANIVALVAGADTTYTELTNISYNYALTALDRLNNESAAVTAIGAGIQPANSDQPIQFILHRSYPNPFNPRTMIKYSTATGGDISLIVYDMRGRLIKVLLHEYRSAGTHTITWDGNNSNGQPTAAGVYLLVARYGRLSRSEKMLLLK